MQNPAPTVGPTEEFLALLQPAGNHFLAWHDGGWKHKPYVEPGEAMPLAGLSYVQPHNIYFAMASFVDQYRTNEHGQQQAYRKQENVDKLRCIWVDIDFKNYTAPQFAVAKLGEFVKATGLPVPSYIVKSGGGLHVYWASDRDMMVHEWDVLARGMRELLKKHGVNADYQVTVNSASVLRLPGTLNHKYTPPVPVTIAGGSKLAYAYETLHGVLAPHAGAGAVLNLEGIQVDANVVQLFGGAQQAVHADQDLAAPRRPFLMAHVATGCGVVADSLARAGRGDSYPLWKNLLHLASFADDGEDFAHKLSSGDPRYDAGETTKRFEESVNAAAANPALGPTLCATFDGLSPKCAACPLRGVIKSPASIKVEETPSGDLEAVAPEHRDPSFIDGGMTWRYVPTPGEPGKVSRKLVVDMVLENFRYTEIGPVPGVHFSYARGSYSGEAEVSATDLKDMPSMKTALSNQKVVFTPAFDKEVHFVIMAWITHLMAKQTRRERPAFGWVYEDSKVTGFAHAGVLYKTDGTEEIAGALEQGMRNYYEPMGSMEPWSKAARVVEKDSRGAVHMLVATAFGSPLMSIGSDAKALTFNFHSRSSGVGKSSNMMIGQAVWGHPRRSGNSTSDTINAVTEKTGKARGLPAYWDEIARERVPQFVEFMFQATQGSTKQRLSQSSTLRPTYEITGFLVACSNDPIKDSVVANRGGPAGLYRYFQVEVQPRSVSAGNKDPEFEATIRNLEENYGRAGTTFSRYIASHYPEVEQLMKANRDRVIKIFGDAEDERFWRQGMTAILTGAELARRADLIRLDQAKIMETFAHIVKDARKECQRVESSTADVVTRMLHDFQQHTLVIDASAAQGANHRTYKPQMLKQPGQGRDLKVVLDLKNDWIIIPVQVVEQWVHGNKTETMDAVKSTIMNELKARYARYSFGAGTVYRVDGRPYVYEIPATQLLGPSWRSQYGFETEEPEE